MSNIRVEQAVDAICNRGCRYVNTLLNDDQQQRQCAELIALEHAEQVIVIDELHSVMAVYNQSGSCSAD